MSKQRDKKDLSERSSHETQGAQHAACDEYRAFYDFAHIGFFSLDVNGRIAAANPNGVAMLAAEPKSLPQQPFERYIAETDRAQWQQQFAIAMGIEAPQQFELNMRRGDGTCFYAHLDCLRSTPGNAAPVLRVVLTDITQHRHAEEELRIAAIVFESRQGMIVTNNRGIIVRVNQAYTSLSGYTPRELIGHPPRLLKSTQQNDAFYQNIKDELKEKKYWQGEIWNQHKSGTVYAAWLTITAVCDPGGKVTHYVGTFSDITANKEAEVEIQRLAFHDPLTKLPNRRLLYDRIGRAMAASSRNGRYGALLFLDLDNFKALNETLGHDLGDQWLIEVARRIRGGVREGDTVARIGGDEFVVMLIDLSIATNEAAVQASLVSDALRNAISQPHSLSGEEYSGTTSIGIALFHSHDTTVDDALKRADLALYQAKRAGRDVVRFYEPDMQAALEERNALKTELSLALARKELQLYYQAQMDEHNHVVGAEVLLRWVHPQRGLLPHADFISLAEDTGLIVPIGHWVLETACKRLRAWEEVPAMRTLHLAVNISSRQLRQAGFVDEVRGVLEKTGADPHRLKLEVTEHTVREDVDDTIAKMEALKTIGVGFAMDDFGTGYSSLFYLQRLPLDQLKIDVSFVKDLTSDSNNASIVQTIIAMGRTLGRNVIAEGVETEAQRDYLCQSGCTNFQGYLFNRPLPTSEFEEFVRDKDTAVHSSE